MQHEMYTITIKFEVCPITQAKVLNEIKTLRMYVLGDEFSGKPPCFEHASNVHVTVTHENLEA